MYLYQLIFIQLFYPILLKTYVTNIKLFIIIHSILSQTLHKKN